MQVFINKKKKIMITMYVYGAAIYAQMILVGLCLIGILIGFGKKNKKILK